MPRSPRFLKISLAFLTSKAFTKNLVDVIDENDLQILDDFLRDVLQILFVLFRADDGFDTTAMRGHHSFPLGRQLPRTRPTQGHFTGHGDRALNRNAHHGRHDTGRHRDAGRRSVFRNRAFGNVDVDVGIVEPFFVHAEQTDRVSARSSWPPSRIPSSRRRVGP